MNFWMCYPKGGFPGGEISRAMESHFRTEFPRRVLSFLGSCGDWEVQHRHDPWGINGFPSDYSLSFDRDNQQPCREDRHLHLNGDGGWKEGFNVQYQWIIGGREFSGKVEDVTVSGTKGVLLNTKLQEVILNFREQVIRVSSLPD
jgi:hypothetical protein